jgi:hypothetical protein
MALIQLPVSAKLCSVRLVSRAGVVTGISEVNLLPVGQNMITHIVTSALTGPLVKKK